MIVGPPTSTMRPMRSRVSPLRSSSRSHHLHGPVGDGQHDPGEVRGLERHVHHQLLAVDGHRLHQRHRRRRARPQLDLRVLARRAQPPEERSQRRIRPRQLLPRRGRQPRQHQVEQPRVHVAPAEEVVPVVIDDAQHAFARLQQRHVERPAAEVVDQPRRRILAPVPPGRQRRRHRLLQVLHPREPGEPRRFTGGARLRQLEERRHRDDRGRRRVAERPLRARPQRGEHQRRQLLWTFVHPGRAERELPVRPHQPLELGARVLRIGVEKLPRPRSHHGLPARIEPDHAGEQRRSVRVTHRSRVLVLKEDGHRVGGPEIDAEKRGRRRGRAHEAMSSVGRMTPPGQSVPRVSAASVLRLADQAVGGGAADGRNAAPELAGRQRALLPDLGAGGGHLVLGVPAWNRRSPARGGQRGMSQARAERRDASRRTLPWRTG